MAGSCDPDADRRYGRGMHIARSGRFVFVAQWVAAVLLPVFFFLGRGLVGAELGWMAIIGVVYGLLVVVVLLLPPVMTLFDRTVRRGKATRFALRHRELRPVGGVHPRRRSACPTRVTAATSTPR